MNKIEVPLEVFRFSTTSQAVCNSFAYVEDRILSLNYLHSILDDLLWRIYLQIILHADGKMGGTTAGQHQFNSAYGKCSLKKYYDCIKKLESYGLIRTRNATKKWITKIPLLAPLWSEEDEKFVDILPFARTTKNLISNGRPFSIVPKTAFEAILMDKSLSITSIRLILKLYKYYLPDTFTGIDPNLIHIKGEDLLYDERIFHDLGISESDIKFYLAELAPYFSLKEVTVCTKPLDKEMRLTVLNGEVKTMDQKKILMLIPAYRYQEAEFESITGNPV